MLPELIVTGQHADLDLSAYGMGELPAIPLGCPGRPEPYNHAKEVTAALLRVLKRGRPPQLVVVQGDTSSAYGPARAASLVEIPIAHVEAGLRSHDSSMPWPEEEFRVAIDAMSDLLFAPSELSASNLRAENVKGSVFVTGNTSIDALLQITNGPAKPRCKQSKRLLVTCHRRENWREGLESVVEALRQLGATANPDLRISFVLPPNSYVADRVRGLVGDDGLIELLPACSHHEMLEHMQAVHLMLSDSGGIQEEAPALGLPLLVLREKTERPEGVATGNMRLVGTDCDRIVETVRGLLNNPAELAAMARPSFPYGDGRAGERIAEEIGAWLCRDSRNPGGKPNGSARVNHAA